MFFLLGSYSLSSNSNRLPAYLDIVNSYGIINLNFYNAPKEDYYGYLFYCFTPPIG